MADPNVQDPLAPTPRPDRGRDELPALCDRLRPDLRRVLWRYRIPPEDAEDLVQTTFLLALTKWPTIENPGPWLIGTLQKRCIAYWRDRRLRTERHVRLEEWAPQLAIETPQDRRDQLTDLDTACRNLSAEQRGLLILRFHLGLSESEAAREAGLAPGSVRKTTHRAVARLRLMVGAAAAGHEEPDDEPAREVSWEAATIAYLQNFSRNTARIYAGHLRIAGSCLGCSTVAEVTSARLRDYRTGVLADRRTQGTQAQALCALRGFLLWANGRRLLLLDPGLIRGTLRGPHRRREPITL
jgi:RNA polymerase sigma factor (sigma-70 family)